MNFAFLGRMIPEEMQKEVAAFSVHNMQDAANALQWHLYDGLCRNSGKAIHIINLLPVGSFPQYCKRPFIAKRYFSTAHCAENLNVGFCNVKLIRNYFQKKSAKRALLKWCEEDQENRVVFLYTLSVAFLSAVESVKKKYPELKACAIVADLPDMSSLSSKHGRLLRSFRKKMSDISYSKLDVVDAFVLLTAQMADYMHIKKPFCVVEGISTAHGEVPSFAVQADCQKRILYTGTLHKRFGVMHLVEAFGRLQGDEYELVLCGVGDSEDEIREAALKDGRIRFLGQRPRCEVLALQKEATVLVNPRQNIEEFTKYSFPSKNLEYLSSGRPLVAYKLDGIPDEYDRYIYYVEDNSIDALTEQLRAVCNMSTDELAEHCKKAYDFVQNEKNEIKQTEIILDMLGRENIL